MVHRSCLVALLLVGCAAHEPATPAAAPEPPSSKAETATPAAAPKQEATPTAAATPQAAASPDDLRQVLQTVIDDEALTNYLHLEQRNRFPLRISGRDLPKDL